MTRISSHQGRDNVGTRKIQKCRQKHLRLVSTIDVWNILVVFTIITTTTTIRTTATATSIILAQEDGMDLSCDAQTDNCPFQQDGECDSELGSNIIGCERGDCLDCRDACAAYNLDCAGCLSNGCYWCPGDAACYNSPFYSFGGNIDSCPDASSHFHASSSELGEFVCDAPGNFFSDPLYSAQNWVFEMIDIRPVWERGYFGEGIRMRINDDGFAVNHPEFEDRFDVDASCNNEDYLPRVPVEDYSHGTAVASIAAASANNGQCSVGVSPKVTLSACYAFHGTVDFLWTKIDQMDVSQNSFGAPGCSEASRRLREGKSSSRRLQASCPFSYSNVFYMSPCDICDFSADQLSTDCEDIIIFHCSLFYEEDPDGCVEFLELFVRGGECEYNTLTLDEREGLTAGVTQGRDGKGVIYVFASGNDYKSGEDANFEGLVNTRFTISVGAVGKDELHTSYSTPGAALFVTGPGGDRESITNHVTAYVGGGCYEAGTGTSFSCPVVSAVVALMLEANPELTWRDVQGILALTSRPVMDDPDDDTLVTNDGGFTHSSFYGFGIVNANMAVNAAETWVNFGPEQILVGESGIINMAIVDSESVSAVSTATITTNPEAADFVTESVVLLLDLRHFSRGDLDVILTSPKGTSSVMHPGKRPEATQLDVDERWKLMTVRAWGESPVGEWTLTVTDLKRGDTLACVDHLWHVEIPGMRVECSTFESAGYCEDGLADTVLAVVEGNDFVFDLTDDDEGLTAEAACCACGGGRTRDDNDFVDQVVQWRIAVYGHSSGDVSIPPNTSVPGTSNAPTPVATNSSESASGPGASPSSGPTPMPTPMPSDMPSLIPSDTPSLRPSSFPTNSPSNPPTTAPSIPPTNSPSSSPSRSPFLDIGNIINSSPSGAGSRLRHNMPVVVGATFALFFAFLVWR